MIPNIHIPPCQTSKPIGLSSHNEACDQVLGQIIDETLWETVFDLHDAFEE